MTDKEKPTCVVIPSGEQYGSKQTLSYFGGISAENSGAQGICMHLVTIPPAARAKAHLHEGHESVLYVLSGQAGMWFGENLEEHVDCKPGDYLYIPAGVPHLPYNASDSEPCTAVVARTDPNEEEGVVLLPELDKVH
ncbi:MAG: putative RmlC-like cupin family protein [Cellvibrionaceae bacterium]|jgi:uncharacterized RmlC-like cupin family protein